MRIAWLLLASAVCGPALTEAQTPVPSPTPSPSPFPALPAPALPPGPPAAEPKKDAVPEDEVRIRADATQMDRNHGSYRGFVDLRAGDTRIQADKLDMYEEHKPDGKTSRTLVAEGNVVRELLS